MSPRDNQSTSHLLFEVLEPRLLLATVPLFGQTDPAWANDPMVDSSSGLTVGTIQQYGCAMTCTAMLAKYYGVETDPKQLNAWLNTHQGYVNGANLVWAKPAEYTGGLMTYEDSFRWSSPYPYNDNDHWSDLKAQLDQGYPVIVEVDAYPSTPALDQHWVLVTGFLGGSTTSPSSYAINDPRDGTTATLDRYYDGPYDNTFFGIRVYHGVASANLPAPVLIGPGTGSFPGQTLSTTTPTFQWQSVSGADQYGVYIREMNADGSAGALVFNSVDLGISIAGSATSYILPGGYLQNGRRYRWNMSAHNSAGWSPNYAIPLYFNVSLGGPVITDRQKQDDLLQIVNTHRGTLPSELVLAAIRQEGGEGAFHVDGWAYNSFYLQDDGAWAQPTNGDGVMQVTEESWHHEVSGPYSHDEIGYDYAIDDGCDYLLENFSSYGSLVQAALHYNTGPNSLYIYLGRNWGDRSYLSNMAGHLDAFVPNYYGLVNPLLGTILRQGQTVLDDYLYGKGILAGQAVSYYAPYQAQLDGDLYAIEAGDTIRPTVDNFLVTPDSVVAGNSFTISYTVSDTGGSGLKQVELWRTSDPTGTSGWNEVVSVRRSLSGSGNGPVPGTFSDGSALPPGTYLYGIHVVDNAGYYSTEQDAGWSPKMVTVAPPLADLRGNTFDSQEPLIAGQTFNVIFSLDNNGSTGAGGFWVDFYLSSNSTITTSDKYLGDYYVSGLPPGSCTLPLTATLTLPARNDAFWSNDGTYYVGMIVDSTGAIPESDETNNQNRGDGYDRDPVQIAGTGNQAPVVNGQTLGPVAENSANGTVVGSVAASDPDTGQSLTYAITGGNTGNAFAINATTGQITVATSAALNYETTPSFALTVQVTDNGTPALSDTGTVTINLTNVNEMPTGVSLSSTTVAENQPAGTAVGTLSTVDPDVGNT
ncbi:MAG: cadherin domain-containing protein, partial [Planctomycetes bacterium]|nr:cadherin domain-containing protein [Planctomycetota bacterium]